MNNYSKIIRIVYNFTLFFILIALLNKCTSSEPVPDDLAPPLGACLTSDKTLYFWALNKEENFTGYNIYEAFPSDITSVTCTEEELQYFNGDSEKCRAWKKLEEFRNNKDKSGMANPYNNQSANLKVNPSTKDLPTIRTHATVNQATLVQVNIADMVNDGSYIAITAYSIYDNLDSPLSEILKVGINSCTSSTP